MKLETESAAKTTTKIIIELLKYFSIANASPDAAIFVIKYDVKTPINTTNAPDKNVLFIL